MILVSITMRYGTLTQRHARRFRNETEVTLEWYVGLTYPFIYSIAVLKVRQMLPQPAVTQAGMLRVQSMLCGQSRKN
jgi:uncharacterized membrane protein